jgi:UDP:flavonoid glycosyltransferase YjiC (YdhE family)
MYAGRVPANARVADLLPGDRMAQCASVVVGNGGSPTSYQALRAGRPVIGVCDNLDQYLNMSLVERAGAGLLLRAGRLSRAIVRRSVQQALGDERMRARARDLAHVIAGYRTMDRFRDAVAAAAAGGPTGGAGGVGVATPDRAG